MDIFKDLFKPQEKKKVEDQMRVAERSLDHVGMIARKCLEIPVFEQYRKDFQRAQDSMLESMIAYNKSFVQDDRGDTTKYALTMVRLFTKLEDFKSLLRKVENDAKKDLKKEEKDSEK